MRTVYNRDRILAPAGANHRVHGPFRLGQRNRGRTRRRNVVFRARKHRADHDSGAVTSYPLPTSGDGEAGIAAGPDGAMWFTEYSNNTLAKIGRITTSGVFTEYALPNPASEPTTITAGPDGALWFIEATTTNIGRITTSGTITEIPMPASALKFRRVRDHRRSRWRTVVYPVLQLQRNPAHDHGRSVHGVPDLDYREHRFLRHHRRPGWRHMVCRFWGNLVSRFPPRKDRPDHDVGNDHRVPFAQAGDLPFAIAAGPDGALWFSDYLGQIGRITTSGAVTSEVPTPTNTADGYLEVGPDSIAAGPDGAMWFIEPGEIGRIPTGVSVTPPTITQVANAESGAPTIAPNTWVFIKGSNLAKAGDSRIWQDSDFVNGQMPTQLDGVSVTVNGQPAYIYYISPTQFNILTPPGATFRIRPDPVSPTTEPPARTFTAQAQAESPSFFVFNGGPYIAAVHLNGSLIGPTTLYPGYSTPAQPGETIVIYRQWIRSRLRRRCEPGPHRSRDRFRRCR